MYRVINTFADKFDNNVIYDVGDEYPREGFEVGEERIKFLMQSDTLLSGAAIEEVKDDKEDENTNDVEKLKVSEIRDLLTEKGIEYDPKAKKEELVKLLG